MSLLQVALEHGFTSLEAFSRSFKNYYNVSPDEFRNSEDEVKLSIIQKKTDSDLHVQIDPNSFLPGAINEADFENLDVKVIKILPKKLVYIPLTLSSINTITSGFRKVKQWALAREISQPDAQPFGILLDYPMYTSLEKCRYLTCMEVEEKPEISGNICYMELPSRTYARLKVTGGMSQMIKHITAFAALWLPESGYEIHHIPAIHIPWKIL